MFSSRIIALFLLIAFTALPVYALDEGVANLRWTGKAFTAIARQASPSVVFIQVEGSSKDNILPPFLSPFDEKWPFGDKFFERFFEDPTQKAPKGEKRFSMGLGSGFVFSTKKGLLSSKAFILTNNHVVEGAEKISVRFSNGRKFDAEVIGTDPKSDLAVIEIKADDIPALRWGDSSQLDVGEWVVAIGNPFGLNNSLPVGVVSAKGRTTLGISDYEDFIQTDAAINPGNSGGPLVNLSGEVVGINTAIFSRSGGYMGVGFAIPSNLAQGIANQLIESGEVTAVTWES
jgi:serine protease Do